MAHRLSKGRRETAIKLGESVEQELAKLKMADTQFMVQVEQDASDNVGEDICQLFTHRIGSCLIFINY